MAWQRSARVSTIKYQASSVCSCYLRTSRDGSLDQIQFRCNAGRNHVEIYAKSLGLDLNKYLYSN